MRLAILPILLTLLLTSSLLAGCRNGTSHEPPLTIGEIAPTSGPAGGTANFSVIVTGGTPPYFFNWEFGSWGTPSISDTATPTVLLTETPDSYVGTLTVTDSDTGLSAVPINFEVTADAITAVSPLDAGLPLGTAIFEATASGSPSSLQWDFGTGAEPSTSSATEPEVVLQNPGTYQGTVTPFFGDAIGVAFPFEYTVAEPVAPEWKIMRLGDASTQEGWINLIEHEERLTAIYVNSGNLICSRAKVADPQSDLDWDSHIIGPGLIAAHHCVASIGGRLAIVYFTTSAATGSKLRFAISNASVPVSSGDWTTYELPFFAHPPFGLTLANIDDERLMLACAQFSAESGMRIAISDSATPTAPEDWANTYLLNKEAGGFFWPEFEVREEDIMLAVQEGAGVTAKSVCRMLRTSSREPESGEDWDLLDWIPSSQFGSSDGAHDLKMLNGKPWVLTAPISGSQPRAVRMFFSSELTPMTQGDWALTSLGTKLTTPYLPVGLPEIAARPAIVLLNYGDQTIRVARSVRVDPTLAENWETPVVLTYGTSGGGVIGVCSAVDYGDRIAIAVLTGTGAQIALAQGPY